MGEILTNLIYKDKTGCRNILCTNERFFLYVFYFIDRKGINPTSLSTACPLVFGIGLQISKS